MKQEDITPEFVIALYRKHGLRPSAGNVFVQDGHCCAMGVVAVELDIKDNHYRALTEHFGGTSFVDRIERGFDAGMNPKHQLKDQPSPFVTGFEIAKACLKAFPVTAR